ncbi:MAG: serine hydrolase domain-containing protein [Chitinophagales bacterium]
MKKLIFPVVLLGLFIAGISSCKKDKTIKSNAKVFKVELFKQNLDSQLNGVAIGYAFVINKDGQFADSASGGIARATSPAGGSNSTPMSIHSTINIASVTKAFTAMCAIKLLDQNNLTIEDTIGPWLPSYWNKNSAIAKLTFKELLRHRSGIQESNTSWDSLKATAAQPLDDPTKGYRYANANFALFRAMIPKLYDKNTFNSQENLQVQGTITSNFETWMSLKYIAVMQELVFTPAGVYNATCNLNPNNTNCQAFNELPANSLVPKENGDWTELCGGGGFNLTTWQMAAVMAFLAHSDAILNGTQKTRMDDNMMGWDNIDSPTSTQGKIYGKDGALYWDNDGDKTIDAGDSGLQTLVQKYPNGVELILTINSVGSGWRNPANMALGAYEAAWVSE